MAPLIWLASYPKSGNTWLRIILANYLGGGVAPVNINSLDAGIISSHRAAFDEFVGVEASDLNAHEISRYQAEIYGRMMAESVDPIVVKVHDAFRRPNGSSAFDITSGMRAIYVVRNPLDVAVSLAHHSGWPIDESIDKMRDGFILSRSWRRLSEQLEQPLPNWSEHVLGWTTSDEASPFVVRYEDMLASTSNVARETIAAIGLAISEEKLDRAVRFSNFSTLREQEDRDGFRERPLTAERFFRRGVAGAWRDEMSRDQVQRIVDSHHVVMAQFGYLPPG